MTRPPLIVPVLVGSVTFCPREAPYGVLTAKVRPVRFVEPAKDTQKRGAGSRDAGGRPRHDRGG